MGPIEESTRLNVSALSTTHPMRDALSEVSYRLARTLDDGAKLMEAAVSKELRAVLAELAGLVEEGEDDLAASMSTPVQHPPH